MSFYKRLVGLLPAGISEAKRARLVDVDRTRLKSWRIHDEAGHPVTPRPETIQKVAKRLNVSEIYLSEGLGPIDPKEAEEWKRTNSNGGCNEHCPPHAS